GPCDSKSHKPLLRFRGPEVGEALGIPFKKVVVRKGIWSKNAFVQPAIFTANVYTHKVIVRHADRVNWNMAPRVREIVPEDHAEQLMDRLRHRIEFNAPIYDLQSARSPGEAVISTAPMSINLNLCGLESESKFEFAPIIVRRWRIKNCAVHQTVYFPAIEIPLYRASITRSEEHTSELQSRENLVCRLLLEKKTKTMNT